MFKSPPSLSAARLQASLIVRQYDFQSPGQIELENIAYRLGITVKPVPLNKVEAVLLRKGPRGIICINNRDMETGRQRFAIAHELGHWHCHENLSQAWLCTSDSIQGYKGNNHEIEANAFAAELLMPKSLLLPRFKGQDLTIGLICRIAEEFGTSLTATAVRLVEESNDDCCVIFSDANFVRWSRKSRRAADVWIPQAISEHSRAWDCGTQPVDSRGPRKATLENWLSGRALQDYSNLWEESVFLPGYGIVITVLTFA